MALRLDPEHARAACTEAQQPGRLQADGRIQACKYRSSASRVEESWHSWGALQRNPTATGLLSERLARGARRLSSLVVSEGSDDRCCDLVSSPRRIWPLLLILPRTPHPTLIILLLPTGAPLALPERLPAVMLRV